MNLRDAIRRARGGDAPIKMARGGAQPGTPWPPSPDKQIIRRAVVMLSGGIDSTVLLALACWSYEDVRAICFWYGQRHSLEVSHARRIANRGGVPFYCVTLDPGIWKLVPLVTPSGPDLPLDRSRHAIASSGVPSSFVPGRNLVFLSHAVALAATLGGGDVLMAANADDQAGYPDCRPGFIAAASDAARTTMPEVGVRVVAPFVTLTKRQIVQLGRRLAVDFDMTWSCYRPQPTGHSLQAPQPCGRCDACVLRNDALTAGDPAAGKE